jgi:2-oxoacid:acceptor oxidoreductase gamma subunit (pyruvate/2-ketoisovalerate family)
MGEQRDYLEMALHGRGGQGVKTTGDLLVYSLFEEGYRVNGQPLYGGERMGAPVIYFLRFNRSGQQIDDRSVVRQPQIMLIFDPTMLNTVPGLLANLDPDGLLLLNTRKSAAELSSLGPRHIAALPASQIAKECGLTRGNVPIVSPVMVGAFARVTGLVSVPTLEKYVEKLFGGLSKARLEGNYMGLRRGYEAVEPIEGIYSSFGRG